MVDGGTKLQMPISRRAQSWPPAEPGGCGNLPASQSMHAAELDAPVAELYVPERKGGRRSRGRGPVSSPASRERLAAHQQSRNRETQIAI